ncbi:MAG: YifB family Mg chelatase-like AAA ATPase [Rhodospirillales bacterium]|nr:YifB family Mg chelatase-like AAA ATPase [Rhodospirillales bacterium]MCB9964734.1 YifB family Mg chelatase-like AAA ATPase [Rhodospirillales bacterium]MCB9980618.1 YifB family Mg chelatase-like AAA ATPase [Rhodospirillales bacterium]
MVACIPTVSFQGVEVKPIEVEVQISGGIVAFTIVGLPDKAVAESRERVRGALHALGLSLPAKRLTVNLAPADTPKEGSHYDLPIAIGLLCAMEILPGAEMANYVTLGELSLGADIRSVNGVLPAAMHAAEHGKGLICPESCGSEAVWGGDLEILAPKDLLQLINHIKGTQVLTRPHAEQSGGPSSIYTDLANVKGQETARRALEITAAGGHNLLMNGPPGSGKSMMASCLPGILPPLSPRESLEVSMIHSLAGTLPEGGLLRERPYRDPHYSASLPALVGGGAKPKPGEISLAHRGVLFLDELPEFDRRTLESLRQPLETGQALIARANQHVTYPADFQLIAAMNPCRCGHLGDPDLECTRAPRCAGEYQSKISGPLLDRIDLYVDVPPVPVTELSALPHGEPSASVRERVIAARLLQKKRFESLGESLETNAEASGVLLEKIAPLAPAAQDILNKATETLKLSARAYHRMIRVARTIADLDGGPEIIAAHHMAEALSYRRPRLI